MCMEIPPLITSGCRLGPSSSTLSSLHSKWIGTSLTRGGLIFTHGIGVSPVSVNSESPSGKPLAESTISFHTGCVTTLKQNSPVPDVLERVLLAAVRIARDGQRDHRWNDTHHGEEGKR